MFSKLDALMLHSDCVSFAMNEATHELFVAEMQKLGGTGPQIDANGRSTYRGRPIVIDDGMRDGQMRTVPRG